MGLDMYLTTGDDTEIGYWRKANAIHAWFVKNVQNGEDNCDRLEVSREQLQQLKATCETVLEHSKLIPGQVDAGKSCVANGPWVRHFEQGQVVEDPTTAINLLPTQEGFFFGSSTYTEWYIRGVEDTIKFCEAALALAEGTKVYYQSSW